MKKLDEILQFPLDPNSFELQREDPRPEWVRFCEDLNIHRDFWDAKLSDLNEQNDLVIEKMKKWMCGKIQNLILFGGTGCGKTHAALALLRYSQKKQPWIQFLTSEKMLQLGEERGTEYLRQIYGEAHVLVIDDLGVEKSAEWQVKFLYSIVNERCGNKNRTIITTNLNEEALIKMYTGRIISRLQAEWAIFNNVDWRELNR